MYIFIAIIIFFLLLFMYSACVISGRCAREEEKEILIKRKDKWLWIIKIWLVYQIWIIMQ